MRLILQAVLCVIVFTTYGQKKTKLPKDLDREKVIFLQYEEIPIDESFPKMAKGYYSRLNNIVRKTNPKLVQYAKDYPFEYTISTRAEYDNLIKDGYKYVLDSEYGEIINNGNYKPNQDVEVLIGVYIKNLVTGEIYTLFKIKDHDSFDHKHIMTKLIKRVKKEYNLD